MSDTITLEQPRTALRTPALTATPPGVIAMWLGLILGPVCLAAAYAVAARADSDAGQAKFVLFWAGILLVVLPAGYRLLSPVLARGERYALLAVTSLYLFVPRILRHPDGPLFFDELAHWRQTEVLTETGQVFTLNQAIRILHAFPGLHTLTASIRHLTGLTTWQVAVALIAFLHVAIVFGIFVLGRHATGNDRAASIAAFVYMLNPAFMFFNSQYAYQTLGIVLLVWGMVAILEATTERPVARGWRAGWAALALCFIVAAIVTHHISGILSAGILGVLGATVALRTLRSRSGPEPEGRAALVTALTLFLTVSALCAAWLATMAGWRQIWNYLSPYPRDGFEQLRQIFDADERRALFVRSGLPAWERFLAFLAPLVAIGAAGAGWRERRRLRDPKAPMLQTSAVLAGLYVLALPFVLTQTGSEGAHRYFPFGYIGLSILAGIGVHAGLARWADGRVAARTAVVVPIATLAAVAIVMIGNLASNANVYYRFPGPWVSGSDTRNLTDEILDATAWFKQLEATERIVADNFNGTTFAAFGSSRIGCTIAAACPRGLPLWDFYFEEGIPIELIDRLRNEDYGYLIVDDRMAEQVSRVGWYFNRFEPLAFERTEPVPRRALEKYEDVPWATKVYSSDHYAIYRLDFSSLGRGVVPPAAPATGPAGDAGR